MGLSSRPGTRSCRCKGGRTREWKGTVVTQLNEPLLSQVPAAGKKRGRKRKDELNSDSPSKKRYFTYIMHILGMDCPKLLASNLFHSKGTRSQTGLSHA